MKQELNLKEADKLLNQHTLNQNLKRHCQAVGKTLSAFYSYYTQNNILTGNMTQEQWEITGILHDADWEKTKDDATKHTLLTIEWLADFETPQEMIDTIKSHNNKTTHLREPETLLEWTLECCDELTGFIVACALVNPTKKLADVSVESVIKKFKQKEFSRAVDRTQITQCEEKVGVPVPTFVEVTLRAMQENSSLLGL